MKAAYIIGIVLVLGLGFLIANRIIKNKSQEAAAPGNGSSKPVTLSGMVITTQPFSDLISVSGSVSANEEVQIRSQVSGIITHIYFNEGAFVQKGQALLKIDDMELQAQLLDALNKENLANENEKRAALLLKKEGISKEEYDIALSALKSLQAQTQLIRAQISKTLIKAPFSGIIGLRNVSAGEYLSPTTVVANLVNLNPLKITFSVPEKYAAQMHINTTVTFHVAGSDSAFKAVVYAIEPSIDISTRTLQMRAKAANNNSLRPGLFVNVDLPLSVINDAILIPTEAVVPVQNGKKVFITENGKAKAVMIQSSSRTDKDLLVVSGLKAGDTLLTTGVMSLKPGMPVKVKLAKSKAL